MRLVVRPAVGRRRALTPSASMPSVNAIPLTPAQWVETATAFAIFGGAVILAVAIPAVIGALVRRSPGSGAREAGEMAVRALRGPLGALLVVQGLFIALRRLSYLDGDREVIDRAWLGVTIAVVTYAAQRVVARLMTWYAERSQRDEHAGAGRSRIGSLPPLRRAVTAAIWILGGLVVLATLGVQISPLLAGLGLGGFAVALALQPLLANVFASSYLLSDQSIRVGDAIQVQGGPSGVIEDIGWRATRIRTGEHNLVIVPNSVLAQATMTNFDATAPETDVTLVLHVSVEDDLARVEEACLDELSRLCDAATTLVAREPGAPAPISFRYQAIDEGRAEILLKVRAASWRAVGELRHLMILRLHSRLRSEGIVLD